jgi:uncharacterized membrane protein YozB (DUF420 family)
MAYLNDTLALIITASLLIQIFVLFLLVYGYRLKKKMKFRKHGIFMTLATILHLTMVLYIMIPSFVEGIIPDYIVPTPLAILSILGLIHGILGTMALLLGVWLAASWRFRKNLKECFNKKKLMCITLNAWILSLFFGIILYAIFIKSLLVP